MATQTVIRTYTLEQAVNRLRDLGMSIGLKTLKAGLLQGVFPFGNCIELDRDVIYIYASLFDRWIAERCIEELIPEIPDH